MRYSAAAVAGNVTLCWIVFGMIEPSAAKARAGSASLPGLDA
jgi:hypothetical protein